MGQMGNLDQIAQKTYAALYLIIHSIYICEILSSIMCCNRCLKVLKISLSRKIQYGSNSAQDYVTLDLMILSKDFLQIF